MKGMNTMDKIDKQRNKEDIMNTFAKAATPIKDESLNAYINNFEKNKKILWAKVLLQFVLQVQMQQ
jgi:hypothetical protein